MKLLALLMGCACVAGAADADPWSALRFLEGTWEVKTQGAPAGVSAVGTYTFRKELGGHILARHSSAAGCKGPADFDCEHGDLLYVFQDAPGQALQAIYFDNEGHVIHYGVSTPSSGMVSFLSDASVPGPQFRLVYELRAGVMSGKFQMRLPGKSEWTSYLERGGEEITPRVSDGPCSAVRLCAPKAGSH